jgi:D-threo-aldose 1-dehydrogenase
VNQRIEQLSLPVLGVGTGVWKWGERETSREDLRAIVDANLAMAAATGQPALFDTAPRYGSGFSETRLGELLRGVPRESYRISTKTGYSIDDLESQILLGRDDIHRVVEGSLRRLNTDYLDILHLHDPDCCLDDSLDTAFPAMIELREQGLVRAVGAGMNQWEMLDIFVQRVDLDCCLLAGRYTLLEQEALEFMDRCAEKGVAVLLGSVYNSGILATGAVPGARYKYVPAGPEILEKVRRMEAVCARHGVPLPAAALQFCLGHPAVKSLVVGMVNVKELHTAREGLGVSIPAALWDELKDEGLIERAAPVRVQ